MRKKTASLGALLLVLAVYFFTNASTGTSLASSLGVVGTDTVYDRTSVVPIGVQNYSFAQTRLETGDLLSVSLTANPVNVDVLLMNQGNFSQWSLHSGASYATYPQSVLHASNYSFMFINAEASQNFYVVLVSHSASQITDVLVHTVVTRPSQFAALLLPVALGAVGVLMLVFSLRGGGPAKGKGPTIPRAASEPEEEEPVPPPVGTTFCRHCGVAIAAGSKFCPSCNRSQT